MIWDPGSKLLAALPRCLHDVQFLTTSTAVIGARRLLLHHCASTSDVGDAEEMVANQATERRLAGCILEFRGRLWLLCVVNFNPFSPYDESSNFMVQSPHTNAVQYCYSHPDV
jgi:hypothetical protein